MLIFFFLVKRLKDSLVDLNNLYVVTTYDYRICTHMYEQARMSDPPTETELVILNGF